MSFIKIELHTEEGTGDITINVKSECTEAELEVATVNMMGMLAQTNGIAFLDEVVKDFYERNEAATDIVDEEPADEDN